MTYNSPTVGDDGTIYIAELSNKLYAINPDGTKKWEFATSGSQINSTPSLGPDGTIYIAETNPGKLYAVNPDGTQRWVFSSADFGLYQSVVGIDGTIYVAGHSKLYAVNPNGTQKWTFFASGADSSPTLGYDNTIYLQAPKTLYAINPDGTQKWAFVNSSIESGDVGSSPAIGLDGTIYAAAVSTCQSSPCLKTLYAVNPNGTQKWSFAFASGAYSKSSPAIDSNGVIYIGSGSGVFYAINPNGAKKWEFTTGWSPYIGSSPAIASDGTIYFGAQDKNLYALSGGSLGLVNSSWPKFKKNNQNTGLVSGAIIPSPSPSPVSIATTSVSYDFALSNDSPKSVIQGSSVSTTISSTITSGSYDSSYLTMFSAANTSGLSMYFSPSGCVVPCITTLNISTSATTTPATYSVVVTATRGSVSKTTTVPVTVTASATAPPPPQSTLATFSNIQAINITNTSTTITWTTDMPATSQVEYAYLGGMSSFTTKDEALVINHSAILNGLNANTKYNYRLYAVNASGIISSSVLSSFTTSATTTSAISANNLASILQSFSDALADIQKQIQKLLR